MEAVSGVEYGAIAVACGVFDDCPSTTPSRQEGQNAATVGLSLANNPMARFQYLTENTTWLFADRNTTAYRQYSEFLHDYLAMVERVDRYMETQQQVQETLFQAMEEDPAMAIQYAQQINDLVASDLEQQRLFIKLSMEELGVNLRVSNGRASFFSRR